MRTIWKYDLSASPDHNMPAGARMLSVQRQGKALTLWAEVDTEQPLTPRYFNVVGTGHDMPIGRGYKDAYIGTVQEGHFVWHVYEITGS